ncbi:MAG: alpha/beta hydrolase [Polyangiaceae bacterium]
MSAIPRRRSVVVLAACAISAFLAGCGSPPVLPLRHGGVVSANATDLDHGTAEFAGVGGTKIFYQWWRPKARARANVVLVHGLKDHSNRYASFAEKLARDGFSVYALDLRGHGHSEGMRVWVDSFDDYLTDVASLTKLVGEAKDAPAKTFVFGHSMGGAIATLYTLEHAKDVSGLVLSGAALEADVSWVKKAGTKFVGAVSPRAGVFDLDLEKFSRDPSVVQECKNDPLVYQEAAPAHTAVELLAAIDRIDEKMGELDTPLLVMHGSADTITPAAGSKALHARARTKDKTLVVYPELVHDLVHEPERERVMDDVLGWLRARAPLPNP